ncbi:MAG: PP2C family serine/threonine-protein phosphatase [Acidobacteriota bacterium]
MARFSLEVGFSTDVGRQRRRNEDSYAVFVPYPGEGNPSQLSGLMLVADGMGGERAGDRASQLAAKRLRHWFSTGIYCSWPQHTGDQPLKSSLIHAIRAVSHEIYQLGEEDPTIRGLGSTVVMGAVAGGHLVAAHVGDSRLYMVRDGSIHLLTSDHSWVQRQVDAGVLTADDARSHPQRNILTRSLGDAMPPEVDAARVELRDRDLFILCSDGLTGGVTDSELLELAGQHPEPQPLAEALVRFANEKDGSDNITAVVGTCRLESADSARELENRSTRQIVVEDAPAVGGAPDSDTEVDIPRPTARQLAEAEDSPPPPDEDTVEMVMRRPRIGSSTREAPSQGSGGGGEHPDEEERDADFENAETVETVMPRRRGDPDSQDSQGVADSTDSQAADSQAVDSQTADSQALDSQTADSRAGAEPLTPTEEFPQLFEGIDKPSWRSWLAAALVALALGLLAGYLVQTASGLETPKVEAPRAPATGPHTPPSPEPER